MSLKKIVANLTHVIILENPSSKTVLNFYVCRDFLDIEYSEPKQRVPR